MTSPEQLQTQITQQEKGLSQLREVMEAHALEFLAAASKRAPQLMRDLAQQLVTRRPDTAKKLGVAGLKKLREEIEQLASQAPDRVTKEMGGDARWFHRGDPLKNPEHRSYRADWLDGGTESGPAYGVKAIHYALRKIVSGIAPVMEKHGFTIAGDREWPDRAVYGGRLGPLYSGSLTWSAEMTRTMNEYDDFATQYLSKTYELETTRRKREEAEAQRLWDRAGE